MTPVGGEDCEKRMLLAEFEAGPVATKGYLVCDGQGGPCLAIDAPAGTAAAMVTQASTWKSTIQYLVDTHGHWDHILDNAELVRRTGARLGVHRDTVPWLTMPQMEYFGYATEIEPSQPDFLLDQGEELTVGGLRFEVLHCPGHCPGSVALFERTERVVFVGDVLFAGSIGRTDVPGGDLDTLIGSIERQLMPLGEDVRVYAGHGPVTTLGEEKESNPYLAAG